MNKDKIISEFSLRSFGSKGWLRGKLACPECNRSDKFGITFKDKGGVAHCFYCSISLPLGKILKDIGRSDLCEFDREYEGVKELKSLREEKLPLTVNIAKLPLGFKKIKNDYYLDRRGFTEEQYIQYGVGVAELDPRTVDKLVFQVCQGGRLVGWLARSRKSKEWHHENLKQSKEGKAPLVLRYRNSENDFSKLLGGIDEITPNTHTVILVEGLFDKANLDRLMKLNEQDEIKCCFTFGSDLNIAQADLIPKTVEKVILMYDAGTVSSIKDAGMRLLSMFEVKVALIQDENVDPGNISEEELSNLFLNLQDFLYFYRSIHASKF